VISLINEQLPKKYIV
jgi:hypothetical protein